MGMIMVEEGLDLGGPVWRTSEVAKSNKEIMAAAGIKLPAGAWTKKKQDAIDPNWKAKLKAFKAEQEAESFMDKVDEAAKGAEKVEPKIGEGKGKDNGWLWLGGSVLVLGVVLFGLKKVTQKKGGLDGLGLFELPADRDGDAGD